MKIRVFPLTLPLLIVCAVGLALLLLPSPATGSANPATYESTFLSNPSNPNLKHSSVSSVDVQTSKVLTSTVDYMPTDDLFANPERGFYHHTETHSDSYNPLSVTTLQGYRQNENITLILRLFYLDEFVNSAISQTYLDAMQADFDTMRQAGVKSVVRFAYTNQVNEGNGIWPPLPPYGDASKAQMLAHLAQLKPLLQANNDVIAVVQAGLIGIWGEWYYTDHFVADPSNPGNVTAADYANRKEVVDAMLDLLPTNRMVQLRTPRSKTNMYSTSAISTVQAFDGSSIARTGHHNDCFLASATDFGTYVDVATEHPYLEAETTYLPMGGETCKPSSDPNDPPHFGCDDALEELAKFHWSYLNTDYYTPTFSIWEEGGCMYDIEHRLGYRLTLLSGLYTDQVKPGDEFAINLDLRNDGFAAPFNPRSVELLLRHTTTGVLYQVALPADPRFWLAGESTYSLNHAICTPADMSLGDYELLLNLPDPEPTLRSDASYAIRLANESVWEANTGYNKLLHIITVNTTATSTTCNSALTLVPGPYYVATNGDNSNPGTLSEPWRTIQHAADSVEPGDTVNVRGGVYNETVFINRSGSAAQGYITFQNYPGETPVLDGSSFASSDGDNGFYVEDQSYLIIKGFEIRNYSTTIDYATPTGIYLTGASHHIQLLNNRLHHIETNAGSDGNAHGIAVYGTQSPASINNILIEGNELYDLKLGNSEALVLNGNVETFTITENLVHDSNNIAIDLIGFEGTSPDSDYDQARDGIVSKNVVYNIDTLNNPAYDDQSAAGIYVDGGTRIIIESNQVYNSNFGIEIASEHQGRATSYVTITNNLIYHNHLAGLAMGGYDTGRGSTENCVIVNNTFFENDTKQDGNGELYIQFDTRNNVIQNNIFVANAQSVLMTNAHTANQDNIVDYNLYFASAGAAGSEWGWQNEYYQGFTAYQTGTGNDSHSQFISPQFVDEAVPNLQLQSSSPAIDAGNNSLCPSEDIRREARNDLACDMGAYELTDSMSVTKSISSIVPISYTFGPTLVAVEITNNNGCLTALMVEQVNEDYPQAPTGIQTGNYWNITPIGCSSGFSATLTLPHSDTISASDARACRYTGSGWDCGDQSNNSSTNNRVTRTAIGQFSPWAAGNAAQALAVNLASFSAEADSEQVRIEWQTVSELDNLGFNLYRGTSLNGDPLLLNSSLIPSQAPGSGQGAAYEWIDNDVEVGATYYYWLEDVSMDGTTTPHDPISATITVLTAVTTGELASNSNSSLKWAILSMGLSLAALYWRRRQA